MKIAYIAHPIGGDVENNLAKIRAIVREINLTEPDVVPFAPYYADCVSLDDSNPAERTRGIRNDMALFQRGVIDEVRLYGERISNGMSEEILLADSLKILVTPAPHLEGELYELRARHAIATCGCWKDGGCPYGC